MPNPTETSASDTPADLLRLMPGISDAVAENARGVMSHSPGQPDLRAAASCHSWTDEDQANDITTVESPNGGQVEQRRSLQTKFQDRLRIDHALTRQLVSYQGNRGQPGFRWLKYKEGFSTGLVERFIAEVNPDSVLDPFSGVGTAPLIAAGSGLKATGIEIMPVGILAGRAIACAANGLNAGAFESVAKELLECVDSKSAPPGEYAFRHVPITEAAFPPETEAALARAREYIAGVEDESIRTLLNVACMSVLESVSFTRKDGQYLRWDYRSGRKLRARVHKGPILSLADALRERLLEILRDISPLKLLYGQGSPEFVVGSSLESLRRLPTASFDMAVTSPPYANRYDYTRTYALELAWLGYDQAAFSSLRQSMLSATVENKSKRQWLREVYGESHLLDAAIRMYETQGAIHEVATILRERVKELGNPHVVRLLEGYFLEMAVIVAELGRIIRPGGVVYMVNDNVRYHGEEVPVDLILSDFAEQSGFDCRRIWVLQRGKGNSSQQMGRFGRLELRKCVYEWVRHD